ncbi:hypothetical protein GCM10010201_18370 [Pilimelia columellifera subsp. columellifera]|uniref:DivIVA domain-containing protein n=1 Tax=Pilimelia columellifera subsp. columellifera TaxID=706583 RepID=A0ABN3NFQ3_9ACTN
MGAIVFAVAALVSGSDPGLDEVEPDGRSLPLPTDRPLVEADVSRVRFDTGARGYRMAQVDAALARAAYDIGYKNELVAVLEAEVTALRAGRADEADALRTAREAAEAAASGPPSDSTQPAAPDRPADAPGGAEADVAAPTQPDGPSDAGPAGAESELVPPAAAPAVAPSGNADIAVSGPPGEPDVAVSNPPSDGTARPTPATAQPDLATAAPTPSTPRPSQAGERAVDPAPRQSDDRAKDRT